MLLLVITNKQHTNLFYHL